MSEQKKTIADFDKPYQEDYLSFGIIIYCGIALFVVMIIAFAAMWYLQYGFAEPMLQKADQENAHPLALKGEEKLPKGLRLQSAPGFGVDNPKGGRINLELREPQAEYRELQKQWKELLEKGEKDEKTGTIVALPIEEAKKQWLEQQGK
jgi:hypothetical protein